MPEIKGFAKNRGWMKYVVFLISVKLIKNTHDNMIALGHGTVSCMECPHKGLALIYRGVFLAVRYISRGLVEFPKHIEATQNGNHFCEIPVILSRPQCVNVRIFLYYYQKISRFHSPSFLLDPTTPGELDDSDFWLQVWWFEMITFLS